MIQVNVIRGGEQALGALMYPPPTASMQNYIETNMQNIYSGAVNLSAQAIEAAKDAYNRFSSSAAIQYAKSMLFKSAGRMADDAIYSVPSSDLSMASLRMQQYVMADPVVQVYYNKELITGYPATYRGSDTTIPTEYSNAYMEVYDGLLRMDDDNIGYVEQYSSDGIERLSIVDQSAIIDTILRVRQLIAMGEDPTDNS